MSENNVKEEPTNVPTEGQSQNLAGTELSVESPKKKGLPMWVVVLVLAVVLAGIYYFFNSATETKAIRLPNKGARTNAMRTHDV